MMYILQVQVFGSLQNSERKAWHRAMVSLKSKKHRGAAAFRVASE